MYNIVYSNFDLIIIYFFHNRKLKQKDLQEVIDAVIIKTAEFNF